MAEQRVNGVALYYEQHGEGAPIVLIHGCGGSALGFAEAVTELSKLGRVIVYDRRGCARNERRRTHRRRGCAARRARGDPGDRDRPQLRRDDHG
jgi:pimeloyl-ACP methyl ester carboxylesterase